MPESWPITLPQRFQQGTFRRAIGDGRLRSPTDTGPGKLRSRSDAVSDPVTGTMVMTTEQVIIMRQFIKVNLARGTLPFELPDPEEGTEPLLVQIGNKMPDVTDRSPGYWNVLLTLDILP